MPLFDSPFAGRMLAGQVRNPNIRVGRYSYYSGYYHGHDFDDCARYLAPDRDDVDKLVIGSFCSIGQEAVFLLDADHRTDCISTYPFRTALLKTLRQEAVSRGDIRVDDDVWIGFRALILSGVHIGQGAVIAAGAVVLSNSKLEPGVYAGVPAKKVKDGTDAVRQSAHKNAQGYMMYKEWFLDDGEGDAGK